MQAKIKTIESQLNEALHSNDARLTLASEAAPAVSPVPKTAGDPMDSSAVTKKLEEELKKRDALIEV